MCCIYNIAKQNKPANGHYKTNKQKKAGGRGRSKQRAQDAPPRYFLKMAHVCSIWARTANRAGDWGLGLIGLAQANASTGDPLIEWLEPGQKPGSDIASAFLF